MTDGANVETEHRFLIFFLATPDPMPFPTGTTVTFLDASVGTELGFEIRVTDEGPVLPQGAETGLPSVSFRFWQVPSRAHPDPLATDPIQEVMRAALPKRHIPRPSRITKLRRRLGGRGVSAPWADENTTVIEMVALVRAEAGVDWVSEGFDRCLVALEDLVRAFRIQSRAPMPHLSYERLPFTVPFAHRGSEPDGDWSGFSMLLLRHFNLPPAAAEPEPLSKAALDETMTLMSFLRREHPFVIFSERAGESEYSLNVAGDYGAAVLNGALSIEVLLDSLICMLCWEEGLPPSQVAADVFSKSLVKRVRTEYHTRLGGTWDLAGTGPLAEWARVLARLRGRVVHRGYRPTRERQRPLSRWPTTSASS